MCFCSCENKKDMEVFKEALFKGYCDKHEAHSDFGSMIIDASDNFTTCFQPMVIDGELVYGLMSYGSDELLFVRDDDEYPLPENSENNSEKLPPGLRKAAALEKEIHLENVRRYSLENVDLSTKRYFPARPFKKYRRTKRMQRLSQTRRGRLWLRFLEIFD